MFLKVSRRARRSSAPELTVQTLPEVPKVDVAPELVRWDDFTRPFPPVSSGGYTKYYQTHTNVTTHDFPSSPPVTPYLSQAIAPSTSRKISQRPAQSPLFPLALSRPTSQKRSLSIIRESSVESMNLKKPFLLTITTTGGTASKPITPASLRRRKRRLLRTPSIERDFAIQAKELFGSLTPINGWSTEAGVSPLNRSMSQSSSSDSHGSPPYSLASPSDSSHPEFPLTPATSIDDEEDQDVVLFANPWVLFDDERAEECVAESAESMKPVQRPGSRAESFTTAKSSLSES